MDWIKQQRIYERKAYRIVQKHVKQIVSNVPVNNANLSSWEALFYFNIKEEQIKAMFEEIYKTIGLDYGNKVNNSLEKITKTNVFFNEELLKKILLFLSNNGGEKITSVKNTLIETIVQSIKDKLEENATVIDLQNAIYFVVTRSQTYFKWQALRIARTETTAASGLAAIESARQSNLVLQKKWIAVKDDRTRHDHTILNEKMVDLDEKFVAASGAKISYPGDLEAPANEVINCRCTISFVPKRDENGMLILKS